MNACKDNTLDADTSDTKVTVEHAEVVNNPVLHIDSDDDFMQQNVRIPVNTHLSH